MNVINKFKKKIRSFFDRIGGAKRTTASYLDVPPKNTEKLQKIEISPQKKSQNPNRKSKRNIHYASPDKSVGTNTARIQKILPLPPPEHVPEMEGKKRFVDFSLPDKILSAVQDLNFKYCTPVQEKTLPLSLKGKDIIGKAQTGTGKTAAFLITIFSRLMAKGPVPSKNGSCRAVVIAPTRELALQIFKDAELIGKYCGFKNSVVFGGMDRRAQRATLKGNIDILVGTPGRIIDFCRSASLDFSNTEILVIDEADRMLDMGFIPDVKRIVSWLPKPTERQTMFFSATLPEDVIRLSRSWLHNPESIESEPDKPVTDLIKQYFYTVSENEKFNVLLHFIKKLDYQRLLIFSNRKDKIFRLTKNLQRAGVACEMLSGDIDQKKRLKVIEHFRAAKIKIVIATDVASRGIHIDGVSYVINYDLPDRPEDYIHRIGRTGRAGAKGASISFVCEYGAYILRELEVLLGQEIKCEFPEDHDFGGKS